MAVRTEDVRYNVLLLVASFDMRALGAAAAENDVEM
jgi:hypothetical protein